MGNSFGLLSLQEVSVGKNVLTISGRQLLLNNGIPITSEEFDYTPSKDSPAIILNPSNPIQQPDFNGEKTRYTLSLEQGDDLIINFKFKEPLKSRKVNVFVTSTASRSEIICGLEWDTRVVEIGTEGTWDWNFTSMFPGLIETSNSMKIHLAVCIQNLNY
jgi:hypothetical protein